MKVTINPKVSINDDYIEKIREAIEALKKAKTLLEELPSDLANVDFEITEKQ